MKQYFILALLLTGAIATDAQVKQGTIIYERKTDVHRHMQDEQMKAMVPQFQTSKHELIFNETISVFKPVTEDEAPDPFNNGGGAIVNIRIGGPGDNGVLYKNFASQKLLEQTEVEDKKYIIDDTIRTLQWKLADETKTILNHVCKKATAKTERGNDVVAWYAEDIASPAGPENFGGLPGAVLLVDVNNGDMVYTATEIKNDIDKKELKEPAEGKHLSRADFQNKMDEIFGKPGSDGSRRIIRRN